METTLKKEGQSKNPLIFLFRMLWKYSENNRKNVVLYWVLFIFANIATLVISPFALAHLVDSVQKEGITDKNFPLLLFYLAINTFSTFVFWAFHGPARVIERGNALAAAINYRKFLFGGIIMLPLDWHAAHHSGNTIDRMSKGSMALYNFSSQSYNSIMLGVRFIVSFVILTYFSPPAGLIVLLMTLASIWITMRFDSIIGKNQAKLAEIENEVSADVFDKISNITTVVILRVEKIVFTAICRSFQGAQSLFHQNNKVIEIKWFLVSVVNGFMTSLILGIYLWQHKGVAAGAIVSSLFLLINYLRELGELFFKFASMYSDVLSDRIKVGNSEKLSQDFCEKSLANHVLPADWKVIEVSNLSFKYSGSEGNCQQLDNVSFFIRRGEKIGLVGRSGHGKTTLLKIIRDLHHPQSLSLKVDSKEIQEGFAGIGNAIALVPQTPEVFATTIENNITFGAHYDREIVDHCVEMACFTEVVGKLPKGLKTKTNERGINLSGGERQRLGVTRGFLHCQGKSIVEFDEPTSSLDEQTELRIYQNIMAEFAGTTILSSIHRSSLFHLFDRIFLFEKGRIIAAGTLKELIASHPHVFKMLQEDEVREKSQES